VTRVFLITGNPGSGTSTLAAELSRRSLVAIDTDDLAFWEDSSGLPVDKPPDADDGWLLAHRWVWSRARMEEAIAAASDGGGRPLFFCGIARNQDQMLDLFEQVFVLRIDEDTQIARLARRLRRFAPTPSDGRSARGGLSSRPKCSLEEQSPLTGRHHPRCSPTACWLSCDKPDAVCV